MKLQEKLQVNTLKAIERKKEIDEGVKLAKQVDAMRKLSAEEQVNLKKFRDESLAILQKDIAEKVSIKGELDKDIRERKEERLRMEAPLDLIVAWDELKVAQKNAEEVNKDILDRETHLITKELSTEVKEKDLFSREEKVRESENLTNRYLSEANIAYEKAEKAKTDADTVKKSADAYEREVSDRLRSREEALLVRERDVSLSEEQNTLDKQANEKEKLHIASQQEALRTAWNQIRALQANKK